MHPTIYYSIFIYVTVVILSVLQSRFKIITDEPITFCICLILAPLIGFMKVKGPITYTAFTGMEILMWTMVLAYFNPKRIVPRINEGYIYAYTLFHWYLLIDTILREGIGFWITVVILISVFPTYLIIKSALENRRLEYKEKIILYYWFLFAIVFTYVDQVALDIITPVLEMYEVNPMNTAYAVFSAVQLYFIATCISLIFVGIPVFHLDKSSDSFKVRWARALNDCREVRRHKLGNYVEYQISIVGFALISLVSAVLFYIDYVNPEFRVYLNFIYVVAFPMLFFYLKYTPKENFEEDKLV